MLKQQKRHVPKPELIGPHRSDNPMFVDEREWSLFRTKVFTWTGVSLAILALGYAIYGPLLRITSVTITGTRLIQPESLKRVTEAYLDERRWLVFPKRTLWLLSSHGLEQHLESSIRRRISIEGVTVTKQRPHGITVTVAERTPVATWTNGVSFGSIDRQGKIIELRTDADATLPKITDENGQTFTTDSSVVKQVVIGAVVALAGYMRQANITVDTYLIPKPVCPEPVVVVDTNTNTGATNANLNINNSKPTNSSTNTNITIINGNRTTNTSPQTNPCDVQDLRYSSQEVHAKLQNGPRVLFDRHGDIQQAVAALQRVLSERSDKQYTSIDVRFGDRVYVK